MLLFHIIGLDSACVLSCLTAHCTSSDQDLKHLRLYPTSVFTQSYGPISARESERKKVWASQKPPWLKGRMGSLLLQSQKCHGMHKSLCRSLCTFFSSGRWAQTGLATQHPICKARRVSPAPLQGDGSWFLSPTLCSTLLKSWAQTDALAKKKKAKISKERVGRHNFAM